MQWLGAALGASRPRMLPHSGHQEQFPGETPLPRGTRSATGGEGQWGALGSSRELLTPRSTYRT